jgi:hypothetical protein
VAAPIDVPELIGASQLSQLPQNGGYVLRLYANLLRIRANALNTFPQKAGVTAMNGEIYDHCFQF